MKRLIAIDPGERVGWATGLLHEYAEGGTKLEVTGHGITPLKPFAIKLDGVFADYDIVIYERWILFSGHAMKLVGSDMQSSQLVGIIRALGWKHPQVKLVGQRPSEMDKDHKTLPPDLKARIDALPKAHDERHDESALLHLWRYYWKRFV